jgi:hypothetical protein
MTGLQAMIPFQHLLAKISFHFNGATHQGEGE